MCEEGRFIDNSKRSWECLLRKGDPVEKQLLYGQVATSQY